jgi:hypothetical protein
VVLAASGVGVSGAHLKVEVAAVELTAGELVDMNLAGGWG